MDLIENKLSAMTVNDRDELREKIILQRALYELSANVGLPLEGIGGYNLLEQAPIPRRGRRRRVGSYA